MKIAHVTATFPPYWAGTGNVAYHNARLMHEYGHEVTVFTAATSNDIDMGFPFKVERLSVVFKVGNAPLTPSLLWKLRGFEVIHLHYPYIFGAELILLASMFFRIPYVLTYHNQLQEKTFIKRLLFKVYNLLNEPLIFARALKICAVRREHFLSLHPKFKQSNHLLEIPNGVDTTLFKPLNKQEARANLNLPIDFPIALFVGALDQAHRFKNVDGLLKAFAQISIPEAQLVIVGDGDLRVQLQTLAEELNLVSRVHFLGKHPPEKLPPIYSAADVLVLPSTEVESFGLVLIEALSCATAIITSDLPGVCDAVSNQVDGLQFSVGSNTELTQALDNLLVNRKLCKNMGSTGQKKIIENYDWQVIGKRLEQVYLELF